jgi:hypothetical protein
MECSFKDKMIKKWIDDNCYDCFMKNDACPECCPVYQRIIDYIEKNRGA